MFSLHLNNSSIIIPAERNEIDNTPSFAKKYHTQSGLCNQLFTLTHGILRAIDKCIDSKQPQKHHNIVLDPFISCIQTGRLVKAGDFLDLGEIERNLYNEFGVSFHFHDRTNLTDESLYHVEVTSIWYGSESQKIGKEISNQVFSWVTDNNKNNDSFTLHIPPGICFNYLAREDVCQNQPKTMCVNLQISPKQAQLTNNSSTPLLYIRINLSEQDIHHYTWSISDIVNQCFKSAIVPFQMYPSHANQKTKFMRILNCVTFSKNLHAAASRLDKRINLNYIPQNTVLIVIHLRIETDALVHWSVCNRVTVAEMKDKLLQKYKHAIQSAIANDNESSLTAFRFFILTHDAGIISQVFNGIDIPLPFDILHHSQSVKSGALQQQTQFLDGREIQASLDLLQMELLIKKDYRRIKFIGCHNIQESRGSTFSFLCMSKLLMASEYILIDLDDVNRDLQHIYNAGDQQSILHHTTEPIRAASIVHQHQGNDSKNEHTRKNILVCLGMHRSGTSLTMNIMAEYFNIPLSEDLMSANPDNPKGYFESVSIGSVNQHVLQTFGHDWKSSFTLNPLPENWWKATDQSYSKSLDVGRHYCIEHIQKELLQHDNIEMQTSQTSNQHIVWGFKDPRTTRLLPFWERIVCDELKMEPIFVVVIRHPQEVVESMLARDINKANGIKSRGLVELLWLEHYISAFTYLFSKSFPFVMVDFNKWFDNPHKQINKLIHALSLHPSHESRVEDEEEKHKLLNTIISKELRNQYIPLSEKSSIQSAFQIKVDNKQFAKTLTSFCEEFYVQATKEEICAKELMSLCQEFESCCKQKAYLQYIERYCKV